MNKCLRLISAVRDGRLMEVVYHSGDGNKQSVDLFMKLARAAPAQRRFRLLSLHSGLIRLANDFIIVGHQNPFARSHKGYFPFPPNSSSKRILSGSFVG